MSWCRPAISCSARSRQKSFLKLDKSKLPNLANAWPVVTGQLATYDPGNNYAANYMWGTTGIGYNVKTAQKILGPDAKIDSWDIVFKPENLAKFKTAASTCWIPPTTSCPRRSAISESIRTRPNRPIWKGRRSRQQDQAQCPQVSFLGISGRAGVG
jgi:hypothetical protein